MLEKPAYAPGCFGKVYTFAKDAVCGACPFADHCEPARDRALDQLQSLYGVQKLPTRPSGELPVKVKQLFEELGRTEDEVRDAMIAGQNPYRVIDGPVGIVAHLLLQCGSIKRSMLSLAVQERLSFKEKTAAVYTRYAIQILTHCGAATVDGDTIKLVRG